MNKIEVLIQKGVRIPNRHSIEIGDEVEVDRIASEGVVLHAGCKLFGRHTLVCRGARLGYEAPATIENCFVGPGVRLDGGFFKEAAFLEKSRCGSGAHVREGTILEEEASIAHTVGLKQTILFPYVTLGSLINFCDCLMTGGTSRDNHSEVGSSYIHFNYTPNQDKATPSIMGDVPQGVMLNHSPIFLGGQGGLVGPTRLAFGTIVAAGTICRKDQIKEDHLILGDKSRSGSVPYTTGSYYNLKRIVRNNLYYLGNLYALRQWYRKVRFRFTGPDFPPDLFEGLESTVMAGIEERFKQLGRLSERIGASKAGEGLFGELAGAWPAIRDSLNDLLVYDGEDELWEDFLAKIDQKIQKEGKAYLRVVKHLDQREVEVGTQWLEGIVRHVVDAASACIPSLGAQSKATQ